ncbi:MAG: hypothetical protein IH801_08145 [Nitrospinae bacterium]|nr:hypothetical protein [Nitrospinota bacterium]
MMPTLAFSGNILILTLRRGHTIMEACRYGFCPLPGDVPCRLKEHHAWVSLYSCRLSGRAWEASS